MTVEYDDIDDEPSDIAMLYGDRPRIRPHRDGWSCECRCFIAYGDDAHDAYQSWCLAWLAYVKSSDFSA